MNTYIIYGITDCPACLRACADLMEADIEYAFVETDFSKSYREHIKDKYGWPTFPVIVHLINKIEIKVGGLDQLKDYLKRPEALT